MRGSLKIPVLSTNADGSVSKQCDSGLLCYCSKAESTALPLFWPSLADNFCICRTLCAPSRLHCIFPVFLWRALSTESVGFCHLGFWSCSSPVHGSWRYILDFATDSHITLEASTVSGNLKYLHSAFPVWWEPLRCHATRSIYCSLGILQNSLPELSSRFCTISNQSKIGSSLWQWDLMR